MASARATHPDQASPNQPWGRMRCTGHGGARGRRCQRVAIPPRVCLGPPVFWAGAGSPCAQVEEQRLSLPVAQDDGAGRVVSVWGRLCPGPSAASSPRGLFPWARAEGRPRGCGEESKSPGGGSAASGPGPLPSGVPHTSRLFEADPAVHLRESPLHPTAPCPAQTVRNVHSSVLSNEHGQQPLRGGSWLAGGISRRVAVRHWPQRGMRSW